MVDTTGRSEAAGEINTLSLQELIALDGFRGVNPEQVFGMKFEGDCKHLPPHAKNCLGIRSALQGCSLDSWARHGMHQNRLPEFSSFDELTTGLSRKEKVRTVIVLQQYLKDIAKRSSAFKDTIFEDETLESASIWIYDMLGGIDEDTKTACAELGVPGYTRQQTETTTRDAPSTSTADTKPVEGKLKRWLKGLLGTPTN